MIKYFVMNGMKKKVVEKGSMTMEVSKIMVAEGIFINFFDFFHPSLMVLRTLVCHIILILWFNDAIILVILVIVS